MTSLHLLTVPGDGEPFMVAVSGWPGELIMAVEDPGQLRDACEFGRVPAAALDQVDLGQVLAAISETRACGVIVVDRQSGWRSATRVEEANHDRPTALLQATLGGDIEEPEPGKVAVFRAGRVIVRPASEFLPWQRWDILDAAWLPPQDPSLPFPGWVHGAPLWMARVGRHSEIWIGEDPLYGPWASPDGTVLVSQDRDELHRYLHDYTGTWGVLGSPLDHGDETVRIVEVDDLAEWLASRSSPLPPVGVVINPGQPRGRQAIIPLGGRRVVSVHGEFELLPSNTIRPVKPAAGWSGYSTLHYPGGPDAQLLPLGRSFCPDPTRTLRSQIRAATDLEVEEVVGELLATGGPEPLMDCPDSDVASMFALVVWDTTEGTVESLYFLDLAQAVAWLAGYERQHDQVVRLEGSFAPGRIGTHGSRDPEREKGFSDRNQAALLRWTRAVMARGYRPSDGDQLSRLVNATFRTLHIEMAGFVGDLLWRRGIDEGDDSLRPADDLQEDALGPAETAWDDDWLPGWGESPPMPLSAARAWLDGVAFSPDARAESVMRDRVGEKTWAVLEPRSRFFLSTAHEDYLARGGSPVLDYAPVNLSLVKALEVELGHILAHFRTSRTHWPAPGDGRNDQILNRYLEDPKTPSPTVGEIRHLFAAPTGPLQGALRDFLQEEERQVVTTSRFRERLAKVVNVYRNGGVHDKPISLATCDACWEDMLGTAARPGLLALATRWKSNGPTAD